MTFPTYIAARFLSAFLRVLAIVVLLIFVIELVETMRIFADKAGAFTDVVRLTLLRVPAVINQVLPLILLLGSLTLFVGLARSSELVISRAAGISALRLVTVPVVTAMIIGVVAVSVFNPIVAATTRSYDALRDDIMQANRSVLSVSQQGLWLRQVLNDRQTVIFARRASPDGAVLFDTEFHVFDSAGSLTQRILADAAQLTGNTWELTNLRRWSVRTAEGTEVRPIERHDSGTLLTNLTSEQILDSFAPPQTISVWQLPETIRQLEQSGFTATRHRLFLQSAMALPLTLAAMVLIGAGFTMRHVRFGRTGIMVLLSVLAGFALYSFTSVAGTLGAAGSVPVGIAAWAPPVAAILLVTGLLLHLEDG